MSIEKQGGLRQKNYEKKLFRKHGLKYSRNNCSIISENNLFEREYAKKDV